MYHCLGALVGDYQGSAFEFHYTGNYDFCFDNPLCHITDDSITTIAVMDMIIHDKDNLDDKVVMSYFKKWYDHFPKHKNEFGGNFRKFMMGLPAFTKSWGNGAAMRISPVGWLAKDEEEIKRLSRIITHPSHDNEESYKAAETTAMLIFLANHGIAKQHLRKYAEERYSLFETLDDIRKDNNYRGNSGGGYNESCMKAMPQALSAFFMTDTFDDCLRTIVSGGGDSDTTAAIAMSIAEAYYGSVGEGHEERILKEIGDDNEVINLLKTISE